MGVWLGDAGVERSGVEVGLVGVSVDVAVGVSVGDIVAEGATVGLEVGSDADASVGGAYARKAKASDSALVYTVSAECRVRMWLGWEPTLRLGEARV